MRLTPLNYLSYTNLAFHKSAKQDLELQPDNHFQLRSVPWKVRLQGQDPGSTRTKHQPPSSQESPTGSLCSRGRKAHQLTWAATQRGTPFPSTAKVTVFTPGTGRGGGECKRRLHWDAAIQSDTKPRSRSGLCYNGKDKKTPTCHSWHRYSAPSKRQV